jgi:hypothetical protein
LSIDITPPNLTTYQKEFLYCEERFTVVEACTKSGKTFSHYWWQFEFMLGGNPKYIPFKGHNHWWVAPVSSQASIAYERLKSRIIHTGIFKCYDGKGSQRIHFPNGTILWFKSADRPDSLYGEDVYSVVMDEFTRMKSSAWHAVRSTVTSTNAPVKFIGNYTGNANWGHILGKKAKTDPAYRYFKVTASQAVKEGIIKKEEVDQARNDYPRDIFMALYMAEGSLDADTLFDPDILPNLFTNTYVKARQAEDDSIKAYISADIATHGSDRFVIGVWKGMVLETILAIEKCDAQEVERTIKDLAEKHSVPRSRIVYDADGIGGFLKGYLANAIPFHNGGAAIKVEGKVPINYRNQKAQCYFTLSQKIDDIYIEDDSYSEYIIEELAAVKKAMSGDAKISVSSKEDIKELLGRSPDFADMMMMRMRFEIDSFTGEYFIE